MDGPSLMLKVPGSQPLQQHSSNTPKRLCPGWRQFLSATENPLI